jgi:hypothetical protein
MDCAKFSTEYGHDTNSQDFDSSQHLLMGQGRDTHLEGNAGNAAEGLIQIQYFLGDRFGITYQQCTGRSAHGVELCPGRWGPSALLADLGEGVCVTWIKVVRSLLGSVSKKANAVKTHKEFLGGVTGAPAGLPISASTLPIRLT